MQTIYLCSFDGFLMPEFERAFEGFESDKVQVKFHAGDMFDCNADIFVAPSNSFAFMDGGIDLQFAKNFPDLLKCRIQEHIAQGAEIPVGQAMLVRTGSPKTICIAPTMRVPMILPDDTINPYLAAKAAFFALKKMKEHYNSLAIPGMGTGVGQVPYRKCAEQIRQAADDVWINRPPSNWAEAMYRHNLLTGEEDPQVNLQNRSMRIRNPTE